MSETKDLRFTKNHEWVKIDGNKAYVGITDYAQQALGDIVFVELPEMGAELSAGDLIGTIESVKTVSDIYSPVSGKVIEVNKSLEDDPSVVNNNPYGSYIVVFEVTDSGIADTLMNEAEYAKFCEEEL